MSKKLYQCHATVVWYAYAESLQEAMGLRDQALADDFPPVAEQGGRVIETAPHDVEECWDVQDIVYCAGGEKRSLGSCLADLPRYEVKWKYWEG